MINYIRRALLHWHRRLGLLIMLFVLLFVITGLLLNHTERLSLAKSGAKMPWLLRWYDLQIAPNHSAQQLGGRWLLHFGGDHLYIEGSKSLPCVAPYAGAVLAEQQLIVALCGDGLLLLTPGGELLERLSAGQLPAAYERIGIFNGQVIIGSASHNMPSSWQLDVDSMHLKPVSEDQQAFVAWSKSQPAPNKLVERFWLHEASLLLNWERLLLDIHSGRIVGGWGVWFMDAIAVLMGFLAISGSWLWLSILFRKGKGLGNNKFSN